MKSGNFMVCVLLIAVLVVAVGYDYRVADAKMSVGPVRAGIVNVNQILRSSVKHKEWQDRMGMAENQFQGEMEKLKSELDFLKRDMDTRMEGSPDYLKLLREYMNKDGALTAKQQYYKQEITVQIRAWTEKLYQKIIDKTAEIAKAKGLDIIFGAEDVEVPSPSIRELMLDIKTNKVLYHSRQLDITTEVLAAVDASR